MESTLKGHGYEVIVAKNGAEALLSAKAEPPDLIVADILMPVMDGFELCKRWRAEETLKRIPFMFYTATYTDPKDERLALEIGADRFVLKPQKPDVFLGIIREMLEESRKNGGVREKQTCEKEVEILREYNEALFRKLEKKVTDLEWEIRERKRAEEEARLTNQKLALMTEVAYQDIHNKLTALRGFVELSRKASTEDERLTFVEKEVEILGIISNLIQKTKDYLQMGKNQPQWLTLEPMIEIQFSRISREHEISLSCNLKGLEIYADPLISRVFYNLLHNSVVHGKTVTRISFTFREVAERIVLLCEDDGEGISPELAVDLFHRISGGEGRFGLFFAREFLTIQGMEIAQTGVYGEGARFEIIIPKGKYRFSENSRKQQES